MKKLSVAMNRWETDLGWLYLFLQIMAIPVILGLVNEMLPTPLSTAALNMISFSINFLCVWGIFHRFLWKNLKIAAQKAYAILWPVVGIFALYYCISLGLSFLIPMIHPEFSNINDSTISEIFAQSPILLGVGSVLLVPVVEETLYRGLIFQGLYNRSRLLAYALSAIAFASIHVMGYIGKVDFLTALLCFLQYIPAGLCLGWAYALTDTIWAPIILHTAINLIAILSTR